MPVLRIVKQYNKYSKMGGIIEVDRIEFQCKEDGVRFLQSVVQNRHCGFDVLDAEWALVGLRSDAEILENPSGGYVGSLTPEQQRRLLG